MTLAAVSCLALLVGAHVGFRKGREAGYNVGLAEGRKEPDYIETLCPVCTQAKAYDR